MSARDRCNRCGGRFERSDDAVVPVLRCRDRWREVPASALPLTASSWRECVLLALAAAPLVEIAIAVALEVVP